MANKQEPRTPASAGIQLNNGQAVVDKYLEAMKAPTV